MTRQEVQKNFYHLVWFLYRKFDVFKETNYKDHQVRINVTIITNFLHIYWGELTKFEEDQENSDSLPLYFILDEDNNLLSLSQEVATFFSFKKGDNFDELLRVDDLSLNRLDNFLRVIEIELKSKEGRKYNGLVLKVEMSTKEYSILSGFAVPSDLFLEFPMIDVISTKKLNGIESKVIEARDYVINMEKLFKDDDFDVLPSVNDIIKVIGITAGQLNIGFKKRYNTTFVHFYNHAKNIYAFYIMQSTDYSIKEIAFKCGYNDYNTFYKSFKKQFGYAPNDIRKQSIK